MDWIDEQYEKIRKRLHNLPLFLSGMCYFLGSVLIAAVLGTLTNRICDRQIAMWMENSIVMTEFESNLWIFWQHWNACFYLGAAFLGAMFLFYKNRLVFPPFHRQNTKNADPCFHISCGISRCDRRI